MKQQRLSNRFRRSFLSFVYSLSRAFLVLVLLNAPAAMAGADLAIGLDASPNPAGVGDSIEVTIQVENKGPDPAAFVALGAGIPSQASFVSVTSPYSLLPAPCSFSSGVVICSFPSLPEGGILEAVITVVEPLPGTLLFDASVSSSMDPNPSNDFGTIEVIVDQELVCVEGARVRFQQLDWLTRDGGVRCECSQIGVARFRLRKKAEQCLDENGGCYVNLTTAASSVSDTGSSLMSYWSVRNLYLTYPDKKYMKRSRPSVQFGLPLPASPTCDQCLGELFYGLEVTSAPLTEPTVPPNERAKVKEQGYLVGGFEFCGEIDGEVIECSGGGGSDDSDGPETPQPADCVDPAAKPVKTARISVPSKKLPKIDVDKTSCAAGAAAIGIDYITRGTKIKTDKARKIHDDLSPLMKIDEGGGVGTNPEDMLSGKEQYVDPANKDLPISSSLILEPPCNDEPMGALDDGCALEVFLEFDGKGSHVALVTQITGFDNGQCKITYVDDPNQGNGKKEIAEHVIVTGPTDPRKYAGGKVVGFLAECLSD